MRAMGSPGSLNDIVVSYPAWDRPWEFNQWVVNTIGRNQAESALFEEVWQEALDPRHWRSADLARCGRVAESAVRARFPELSREAVDCIVNAASYQWR